MHARWRFDAAELMLCDVANCRIGCTSRSRYYHSQSELTSCRRQLQQLQLHLLSHRCALPITAAAQYTAHLSHRDYSLHGVCK